jgi:hypothetical protein
MEIASSIITVFRTLISSVYPPFKAKYFNQPKLYIKLVNSGGARIPGPLSPNNNFFKHQDGFLYVEGETAKRFDTLIKSYNLIIRNNSEHHAYHIRLISPSLNNDVTIKPSIDYLKPLLSNQETIYTITFKWIFEGTGQETYQAHEKTFELLLKNSFILEYTNNKNTKFYTTFRFEENVVDGNKFSRKITSDAQPSWA